MFFPFKNQRNATPIAIFGYDITQDGCLDLVTGWSDGVVDVRDTRYIYLGYAVFCVGSGRIYITDACLQ